MIPGRWLPLRALAPGEVDWTSPGITQRGSCIRPGVDRWHHMDGSIRYRLREEPGDNRAAEPPQPVAPDHGPSQEGLRPSTKSFYNDDQPWTNPKAEGEKLQMEDNSTCDPGKGDISTAASSNSSSCGEVGFWRHGVWQARARTPQEARQHRGGGGPQRTLRKQQRVHNYIHAGHMAPRLA